jgi:hypothetical protein
VLTKKLGCSFCADVKELTAYTGNGVRNQLSPEWINNAVTPYGDTKAKMAKSLRKKIHDHKSSTSHKEADKILTTQKDEILLSAIAKKNKETSSTTAKVFRTVYHIAKHNRPYTDHPHLLDLQIANGLDVGCVLQSNVVCADIVDCIAATMKEMLVNEVIQSSAPFSILIDESTSLGKQALMVIYIRSSINDTEPTTFFLDIVAPLSTDANGIYTALMTCVYSHGFTDQYMSEHLVCICTDEASVMLGKHAGVQTLIKNKFPKVVGWHCLNHRLEPSVHDATKSCTEINHFVIFFNKLYCIYSQSSKNVRELASCALELESEVRKIGRLLDTRWVASSFRTAMAVWTSYGALQKHFQLAASDRDHDSKERATFAGLDKKLSSTAFLNNLGIMLDALEELKDLSEALQSRDISLPTANKLIKRQVDVFKGRKDSGGHYQALVTTAVKEMVFCGVPLHISKANEKIINSSQFYQSLIDNMNRRLLEPSDEQLFEKVACIVPSTWPPTLSSTYGEDHLRSLCSFFRLEFNAVRNEYRDFKDNQNLIGGQLSQLRRFVDLIAVSTSECERGFSTMNDVCSSRRTRLLVTHISSLMFIKLVGPPIQLWKPEKYVNRWLSTRRLADSTACMARKEPDYNNHGYKHLWKALE